MKHSSTSSEGKRVPLKAGLLYIGGAALLPASVIALLVSGWDDPAAVHTAGFWLVKAAALVSGGTALAMIRDAWKSVH